MRIWTALFLLVPLAAFPAEPETELDEGNKRFIASAVKEFSRCWGFFELTARYFDSQKQPASATMMRDYARGAKTAGAYLLYLRASAEGIGGKGLESFYEAIEAQGEANINRIMAAIEQDDSETIATERKFCTDLLPMQEDIIQQLRDHAINQ